MSLAFIRQCQHYGPVLLSEPHLLIPLGMKWIQWLWLDQFFYLFSSAFSHCYPHDYSLFLSIHSFLEVWHCTLFYIYSSFKVQYAYAKLHPRTTYCISFIYLLYYILNYMLFVPSLPLLFFSSSLLWKKKKKKTFWLAMRCDKATT